MFVSHNMAAVMGLCQRAFLLETGHKNADGPVAEVVSRYSNLLGQTHEGDLTSIRDRGGTGMARISRIWWTDSQGVELGTLQSGQIVQLWLAYEASKPLHNPVFLVGVYDSLSHRVFFLDSSESGGLPDRLPRGGIARCQIDNLPLPAGSYRLNLAILARNELLDHVIHAAQVQVMAGDFFGTGVLKTHMRACLLDHSWQVVDQTR